MFNRSTTLTAEDLEGRRDLQFIEDFNHGDSEARLMKEDHELVTEPRNEDVAMHKLSTA